MKIDAAPSIRWFGSAVLRGCNVYHARTVVRVDVDLGLLHGQSSAVAGPDLADRFVARFCNDAQTPPTARADSSFFAALYSAAGAPFEDVLLQAIMAVEHRLAFARHDFVPIGLARAERDGADSAHVRLLWESSHPKQSLAAARVALSGLLDLLPAPLRSPTAGDSGEFDAALSVLCQRASRRQASTTTSVIALAAHTRGIPCESIRGPHLQLGHGAEQRIVYASVPPGATLAAAQLSRNKRKTTRRLAQLGLPVTRQSVVESVEQALAAAAVLGYPVVVKPLKGKQASGVSVGVASGDEIPGAFERARAAGSGVLVESLEPGATFRLLLIGGRFTAALRVDVPTVVGDGRSRIDALIEALNHDPRRNGVRLFRVDVDDELRACLARSGRTLADVPPAGTEIALRAAANVACGGIHTDVTDLVHESHRTLAERAAAALGLSVAGIDVVSSDIGRPCDEAGTRILEVNARPGLCMHAFPRHGRGRDVAGAMLELLFPAGATGRIPTALVIGDRGARAVADELDAELRAHGHTTGLVARETVLLAGQTVALDQPRLHEALAVMHRDSRMQRLVVATTPRHAVAHGLALEGADAVALLARNAREDSDTYNQAASVAARAAGRALVVEVDNEPARALFLGMVKAGTLAVGRLILVGGRARDAVLDAHVEAGGTSVVPAHDGQESIVVRRRDATLVLPGHAGTCDPAVRAVRDVRARLLAAALAWAMGPLPLADRQIAEGSAAP